MSQSTAPSMCPCSWASLLTSTSTTRTVGSSRCASSHAGSARTPSPVPGSRVGAFFCGVVVIGASSGSLTLDCSLQPLGGGAADHDRVGGEQPEPVLVALPDRLGVD